MPTRNDTRLNILLLMAKLPTADMSPSLFGTTHSRAAAALALINPEHSFLPQDFLALMKFGFVWALLWCARLVYALSSCFRYKPTAFVVGFPKCGTTALMAMMAMQLSGVVTPSWFAIWGKETNRQQTMRWLPYGTFFPLALRAPSSIAVDGSPDVVFIPHLAESFGPDAKFIFCVRDHLSAFHSYVNFVFLQLLKFDRRIKLRGLLDIMQDPALYLPGSNLVEQVRMWKGCFAKSKTVVEATTTMEVEARRLGIIPLYKAMMIGYEKNIARQSFQFFSVSRIVAQLSMGCHITRWAGTVRKDQIIVIENECLQSNPNFVYSHLAAFLGVSHKCKDIKNKTFNPTKVTSGFSLRPEAAASLSEFFYDDKAILERLSTELLWVK